MKSKPPTHLGGFFLPIEHYALKCSTQGIPMKWQNVPGRALGGLFGAALVLALSGCATPVETSIIDARESDVAGCEDLGTVSGSNAVFVGLSASVGRTHAQNAALNQAAHLRATHVVWRERGTSLTNEWVGTAYACR